MKRIALLGSIFATASSAVFLIFAVPSGAGEFHPFGRKANSAALKAKVVEEFPGAEFPPKEGTVCSSGEHSPDGPTSYCFLEFRIGSTWNIVEAAMTIDLVGGTGVSLRIYSHTTWQRRWKRCRLGGGVPGRLYSNEDCGRGQPEQFQVETDADIIRFDAWPRIRTNKQLHWIGRDFIFSDVVPGLARYRASRENGVYTFTNAFGDSFRYRPNVGSQGLPEGNQWRAQNSPSG